MSPRGVQLGKESGGESHRQLNYHLVGPFHLFLSSSLSNWILGKYDCCIARYHLLTLHLCFKFRSSLAVAKHMHA